MLAVSLVVFGIVAAGLLTFMTGSSQNIVNMQEAAQARYLAESGLAIARNQLTVGTSAERLTQADNLHIQKTMTIPGVGEADLTIFPYWLHTGKNPTEFPLHGGGFPGVVDAYGRRDKNSSSRASTPRSMLQNSTKDILFAAQSRDGSTRLLSLSDTPPEDADIYLVGQLDRAQSRLVNTGEGRWTLTVTPRHGVDRFLFPEREGLIGLVDSSGIIEPDKRFRYRRLRTIGTTCRFEELRPLGHADGEPLPAERFLPHETDFADKDLVLGQYVLMRAVSQSLGKGRDSLADSFIHPGSFRPELTDPKTAFPGMGDLVLGGTGSLSGRTAEQAQHAFDTLFDGNVRGSTEIRADSDGTGGSFFSAYLRETVAAEENHFLKRNLTGFTQDFWTAGITRAEVENWEDVRMYVALASDRSGMGMGNARFEGLLFRTAFADAGDRLTDAGATGLGLGVLEGSIELDVHEDIEGFSVVFGPETTVNPLLLPGFVAVASSSARVQKESPQTFVISRADWDRYSMLYVDPEATTGRKRLKPLLVFWGYDDRPDASASLVWLAVGIQPPAVSERTSASVRLFTRIQEVENSNYIRAWLASERASAPVEWVFVNTQARFIERIPDRHSGSLFARQTETSQPTEVVTSFANGVGFTRAGVFQGMYRADGTPPVASTFTFHDFTVGRGEFLPDSRTLFP